MFALALLLVLNPSSKPQSPDLVAKVKALYLENRWNEVVALTTATAQAPADLDYYRGMALARLERYLEARQAFLAGQRKQPLDKRFPLELAGVAFKQGNASEAKADLKRALRLDPEDTYAIDFLGSLFLLDGNIEAALREWNRIRKPAIEEIRFDPQPLVRPALLDRAFAFSPASVLELPDYETTRANLSLLGIFPRFQFDFLPHAEQEYHKDQKFDLVFRSTERDRWGSSRTDGLLSLFRGAPYQTVYPEYYNLRHEAVNLTSLVRWDAQKRRVSFSVSAPLQGKPQWRYGFHFDGRNEIWDMTQTFHSPGFTLDNLSVETIRAGAEIQSVTSGRLNWTSGADLLDQKLRDRNGAALPQGPLFSNGVALEVQAGLNYKLFDFPEKRFTLETGAAGRLGRVWSSSAYPFAKVEGSLLVHWLPKARGDDYEMSSRFRAGKVSGPVPFDELFILGLERDNDLELSAHIGTHDGKKGSSPLGRDYVLSNSEVDKTLYDGGLVKLRLGPYLDTGKAYDGSGAFGSALWLWDAGARVKIEILGTVALILSYGRDLRSGRNAFYSFVGHE